MGLAYRLIVADPKAHLLEVELRIAAPPEALELVMPSWTPGSYLIREFPRNVQDFSARAADGLPLAFRKTDKNSWRIECGGTAAVTVRYRVYANELSVRTSHVDASHAYVNGASVFLYARGLEDAPVTLEISAPEGWRIATALRERDDGSFGAGDYDELVDCPIEIGAHRSLAWEQKGIPHRFVIWGPGEIDEARLLADTRRIVDVCSAIFGGLPYDRYLFLLHLVPEGRGGLEHATSTSLLVSTASLTTDYEGLLALIAHEHFHVWLGKRIRPEPLGPYDYTAENYTRNLWVVEGFTTYFTDRILLRAGLMSPARYLERLGDSIARLEALPGRHHQSLEESSFDTWIRFYRPDAHSPNSQVSYYHKGSLVALALDLEIRRASDGGRSLEDVMRLLWRRSGMGERGFPEEGEGGIQEVVGEVHGGRVDDLFEAYVHGTEEIDFDRHLGAAGLRLAGDTEPAPADWPPVPAGGGGAVGDAPEDSAERLPPRIAPPPIHEARLGVRLREDGGRLRVAVVLEGTAAHEAGLNAGDELVAVQGRRASVAVLAAALRSRGPGDILDLTVFRRDEALTLHAPLREPHVRRARLVPAPDPDDSQRRILRGWLEQGD